MRNSMLRGCLIVLVLVIFGAPQAMAEDTAKQLQANKTVVIQFIEALTSKNYDLIDQFVALDYIDNGEPSNPAEIKKKFAEFQGAIPDMYITVKDQIAEGDKVVTRGVWGGTQRGVLMGMKAQGKVVEVNFIMIHRLENGKLVEEWDQHDLVGLMEQLGVIPGGG